MSQRAQKKTASQLRPATPMDSVNIVRLIRTQHAESAARYLAAFDDAPVLDYVTTTIRQPECFSLVVEHAGRLLGSVALAPIRIPWSPRTVVMAECWCVIVPQCREKGVPEQLLGAVEKMLDRVKLPTILGSNLLAPSSFDQIMRKREGYELGRSTFVRVGAHASEAAA